MAKSSRKIHAVHPEVQNFIRDVQTLFSIPVQKKHTKMALDEYPFDEQLLSISEIYRQSRKLYRSIGGTYAARVCSTMRSLSAQDLFRSEIEYSPLLSEILWFKDHYREILDPAVLMNAFSAYNEISLFHEQNHRVLWQLLPPAPVEQADFCRYLNFAESLVVTLDLALGDEVGAKYSPAFERLKVLYRPGGEDGYFKKSKNEYRKYLLASVYVTYLVLELTEPEDILPALDYVFPNQKAMNKKAYKRGTELSELFTLNTNRQWQQRFWQQARDRLAVVHAESPEDVLFVPEDPLDFEEEFVLANRVFDFYGL